MPPKPKAEVRLPLHHLANANRAHSQSANLIRVRNNQRRSRARRREYVADLERKLQHCKAKGPPACMREVVPHDTIQKLEGENRKLRELLDLVGVKQALVDAHVGAAAEVEGNNDPGRNSVTAASGDMDSVGDCLLEVEPLSDTIYGVAGVSKSTEGLAGQYDSEDLLAETFLELPNDEFDFSFDQANSLFDPSLMPQLFDELSLPIANHTPQPRSSSCPLSAVPPPCCPDESHLPPSNRLESEMTLCSVAYDMIRQHNKRGVDMIDIGIRLWNGFVKGEGDSGCKVENDLLYSVLEYIKG